MRVLLVNPAESAPEWPTMPRAVEPMGLLYLAAAFEELGVEVDLVDRQLGHGDWRSVCGDVVRGRYGGAGVALASQACLFDGLAIMHDLKSLCPSMPVFTGGVFAALNVAWLLETAPALDLVVPGAGEPFAAEFVAARGDGRRCPTALHRGDAGPALPVEPFLPPKLLPSRALTRLVIDRGEAPSLVVSRGCPGGCSFCCVSRLYGSRWRAREVADVRDELSALVERFGVRRFHLVDDDPLGARRPAWTDALLAALRAFDPPLELKAACRLDDLDPGRIPAMAAAGLGLVKIGVETLGASTQRVYGKPVSREDAAAKLDALKRHGIAVSLGFIMFDPYCGVGDVVENFEFLLARPDDWSRHLLRSRLVAYRQTAIEKRLADDDLAVSTGILGTTWRFADPDVAEVHARFERLLRAELLEPEYDLYAVQRAFCRAGTSPPALDGLGPLLKRCWTDLFMLALDGRTPSGATRERLEGLRRDLDLFCSSGRALLGRTDLLASGGCGREP